MASLTTRHNGSRFISFTDGDGQSRTITLGKVPKRYAETVKIKVEDLSSAVANHHAPRDETARWLAGIDDRLHKTIACITSWADTSRSTTTTGRTRRSTA